MPTAPCVLRVLAACAGVFLQVRPGGGGLRADLRKVSEEGASGTQGQAAETTVASTRGPGYQTIKRACIHTYACTIYILHMSLHLRKGWGRGDGRTDPPEISARFRRISPLAGMRANCERVGSLVDGFFTWGL